MWMRRVRVVLVANHPLMASPSATLSIPHSHHCYQSFPPLKPSPFSFSNSLSTSTRRCLSTTGCSSPLPLVDLGKLISCIQKIPVWFRILFIYFISSAVYFWTGNGDMDAIPQKGAKVLLKGMRYSELEVLLYTLLFVCFKAKSKL